MSDREYQEVMARFWGWADGVKKATGKLPSRATNIPRADTTSDEGLRRHYQYGLQDAIEGITPP
jgi:hypothetical protein